MGIAYVYICRRELRNMGGGFSFSTEIQHRPPLTYTTKQVFIRLLPDYTSSRVGVRCISSDGLTGPSSMTSASQFCTHPRAE